MAETNELELQIWMAQFERRVLMDGALRGLWGTRADVNIRGGFGKSPIGKLVGTVFVHEEVAIITYYGHVKKSTGFLSLAASVWPMGLRRVRALIVAFTDIHRDDVVNLAPDLLPCYDSFRKRVAAAARLGPIAD